MECRRLFKKNHNQRKRNRKNYFFRSFGRRQFRAVSRVETEPRGRPEDPRPFIHEGWRAPRLSLAHAYGAAFEQPGNLKLSRWRRRDGEADTGPLALVGHSSNLWP